MLTYTGIRDDLVIVDLEFIPRGQEAALLATAKDPAGLAADLQRMRDQEAAWNAAATGTQRAVDCGDFCRRNWPGPPPGVQGSPAAVIYGRVWFRDELAVSERGAGAGDAEIGRLLAVFDEGMRRGFRFGRWHSAVTPEGETGWHHVAVLEPVTRQAFTAAKRAGWPA